MLSYEDIVAGYSGSEKGSVLESALNGSMSTMLRTDERAVILKWLRDGAGAPAYAAEIKPIVDQRCLTCHDGRNPRLPSFTTFEGVSKVTTQDAGASIETLVRVSHIHLFGVTFIFFIVGLAFTHAYVRPVWLKCAIIAVPFLAIVIDVSSWYLIKRFHPFAWVDIALASRWRLLRGDVWLTTLYQMWFTKPPEAILLRLGGDIPSHCPRVGRKGNPDRENPAHFSNIVAAWPAAGRGLRSGRRRGRRKRSSRVRERQAVKGGCRVPGLSPRPRALRDLRAVSSA